MYDVLFHVTSSSNVFIHSNTPLSFKLNDCPDTSCAETYTATTIHMQMEMSVMSIDDDDC